MTISKLLSDAKGRMIYLPPPVLLMLLYCVFISLATILLMLPLAAHTPTSFFDALFTAVSAMTVTGLAVVDLGTHYTFFGQLIMAVLIQVGGTGIMTFAVLILSALGLHITTTEQKLLREDLKQTNLSELIKLAWLIFKVILAFELVGAFILAFKFVPEFGWLSGLWYSLFHSISAFNNAGLSLFSDSLSQWVGDPLINISITALFILGGLGYAVLSDLKAQRRWHKLSLHTKLMLSGTLGLIVWALLSFMLLEWHNPATLAGLDSTSARLWASWFQAVTPRSAGFNTVDTALMNESTSLVMMPLMIIGGGSTSTAGGIKVTTFVILLLAAFAFFKRQDGVVAFGQSLGMEQVLKVMAVVTLTLFTILTGLFVLTITNDIPFIDLAFEICSAFGTVGLSRGVTAELDMFGRVVVMAMMFIGHVGPLTLGCFLATRATPAVRHPTGQVFLG